MLQEKGAYHHHPTQHRTIRIRSRWRLCCFITLLLLLILSLLSPVWLRGNAMEPSTLMPIKVSEGDTLWTIARQTVPRGRDIREYIMEIRDVNKLTDAMIYTGQELQIPLYGEYAAAYDMP